MKNRRETIMDHVGRFVFLLLFFVSVSLFSKTSGKHDPDKTAGNSTIQLHLSDAGAIVSERGSLSSLQGPVTFHKKSFPFFKEDPFLVITNRLTQQFSSQQKDYLSVKAKIFSLFYYHFYSPGEEEPIL